MFAGYISLFSKIENKSCSNLQLNEDLRKLVNSKMLFNPDPIKRAIEIGFSHKRDKEVYPSLKFNNSNVQSASNRKQLRLV